MSKITMVPHRSPENKWMKNLSAPQGGSTVVDAVDVARMNAELHQQMDAEYQAKTNSSSDTVTAQAILPRNTENNAEYQSVISALEEQNSALLEQLEAAKSDVEQANELYNDLDATTTAQAENLLQTIEEYKEMVDKNQLVISELKNREPERVEVEVETEVEVEVEVEVLPKVLSLSEVVSTKTKGDTLLLRALVEPEKDSGNEAQKILIKIPFEQLQEKLPKVEEKE